MQSDQETVMNIIRNPVPDSVFKKDLTVTQFLTIFRDKKLLDMCEIVNHTKMFYFREKYIDDVVVVIYTDDIAEDKCKMYNRFMHHINCLAPLLLTGSLIGSELIKGGLYKSYAIYKISPSSKYLRYRLDKMQNKELLRQIYKHIHNNVDNMSKIDKTFGKRCITIDNVLVYSLNDGNISIYLIDIDSTKLSNTKRNDYTNIAAEFEITDDSDDDTDDAGKSKAPVKGGALSVVQVTDPDKYANPPDKARATLISQNLNDELSKIAREPTQFSSDVIRMFPNTTIEKIEVSFDGSAYNRLYTVFQTKLPTEFTNPDDMITKLHRRYDFISYIRQVMMPSGDTQPIYFGARNEKSIFKYVKLLDTNHNSMLRITSGIIGHQNLKTVFSYKLGYPLMYNHDKTMIALADNHIKMTIRNYYHESATADKIAEYLREFIRSKNTTNSAAMVGINNRNIDMEYYLLLRETMIRYKNPHFVMMIGYYTTYDSDVITPDEKYFVSSILTEAPDSFLKERITPNTVRNYAIDVDFNISLDGGFMNYKTITSLKFQLVTIIMFLCQHIIPKIPIKLDYYNLFIKNGYLKNDPKVPIRMWKYVIDGVDFFVPNYGVLLMYDLTIENSTELMSRDYPSFINGAGFNNAMIRAGPIGKTPIDISVIFGYFKNTIDPTVDRASEDELIASLQTYVIHHERLGEINAIKSMKPYTPNLLKFLNDIKLHTVYSDNGTGTGYTKLEDLIDSIILLTAEVIAPGNASQLYAAGGQILPIGAVPPGGIVFDHYITDPLSELNSVPLLHKRNYGVELDRFVKTLEQRVNLHYVSRGANDEVLPRNLNTFTRRPAAYTTTYTTIATWATDLPKWVSNEIFGEIKSWIVYFICVKLYERQYSVIVNGTYALKRRVVRDMIKSFPRLLNPILLSEYTKNESDGIYNNVSGNLVDGSIVTKRVGILKNYLYYDHRIYSYSNMGTLEDDGGIANLFMAPPRMIPPQRNLDDDLIDMSGALDMYVV